MIIRTGITGTLFEGYHRKDCPNLEYHTTVLNKTNHQYVETTGFYDAITDTFATYKMDVNRLRYMTAGSKYETAELISRPVSVSSNMDDFESNIKLTEIQEPVMANMLSCKNPEMFVNLPTAVGKTVLSVHYLAFYNKKCIILCYKKKILDQWYNTLIDKTTINPNRIQIIKSSKYLVDVVEGNISTNDTDIWLITPTLITSFCNTYGWNFIQEVFEKCRIGLKIIDEAHRNLATTIKLNAWTSVEKTMYLSADFNQASYEVRKQFFEVFKNVPVIKLSDDVMKDLKHITAVEFVYNSEPSIEDIMKVTNGNKAHRYHWDHFGYTKYCMRTGILAENTLRIINQIVQSEAGMPMEKPYKILVLTNMIDMVDEMASLIEAQSTGRSVGRYHGRMPKEECANTPECDIIVSTYQAFSTGIDVTVPNFRHVISMNPVDYITANQAAGRNRPIEGLDSYFWMLVDSGFDYCVNNATKVLKYLSLSRIKQIKRIEG